MGTFGIIGNSSLQDVPMVERTFLKMSYPIKSGRSGGNYEVRTDTS